MDGNLKNANIMIVDDEAANLRLLEGMLEFAGYGSLTTVQDPREVLSLCDRNQPDLILLDLNMPHLSGFQVMAQLNARPHVLQPPVLVLTAQADREVMLKALESGARDYVTKPFDMGELLARVRNMLEVQMAHRLLHRQKETLDELVRTRTAELLKTRLQVVQKLGRASEYRDNETGRHIIRVSQTAGLLAQRLGCDPAFCENLVHAAPMHDVGKIGVPDGILLKEGPLTPEEWETMKDHTTIGARILGTDSELLALASEIALTHHERWDGSGYPRGLAREAIPLAGRLVAVADVFDALVSQRTYKNAWPTEAAREQIRAGAGSHFDPAIVAAFEASFPEVLAILESHADELPDTDSPPSQRIADKFA